MKHEAERREQTRDEASDEAERREQTRDEASDEAETEEQHGDVPKLDLQLEDLLEFSMTEAPEVVRLREARETAELAVEYLRFEEGLDVVGRLYSVEWIATKYVKQGQEPEKVPVMVFLGNARILKNGGEVEERNAMFRCYAKSAMAILIAQKRGFEFRLKVGARLTLSDGRTRWSMSIKALSRLIPASL